MLFVPAIVVGDHGDRHVTDLGFARELGLLQIGHADHVHAPTAIDVGFGLGGKRRALHAEVSTALGHVNASLDARFPHDLGKLRADRIGEADVRHQSFAEKSGDAAARAVEKLVRNYEFERRVFFLEGADGAQRNNPLDAERFEAVDVGAEIQLRRGDAMAAAMARKKRDLFPGQLSDDIVVRRPAPRRVDGQLLLYFKARHRIQSAAADNPNGWFHSYIAGFMPV